MRLVVAWLLVLGVSQAPAAAVSVARDARPPESAGERIGSGTEEARAVEAERERLMQVLEGPLDAETYVLGPGDELLLILKGAETALHYLRVFPEGNVILPNLGASRATGLTLAEFRQRVRRSLRRYYRNVEIDCQLSLPRKFVVYVLGEVEKPKPVQMTAPFRISQALTQAGGIKKTGSAREIEIREGGKTVRTVDLFAFLHLGDFDNNPMLKEGQTVFVPPKRRMVEIIGEVRLPGRYEIVAGETVADLIAYCGGIGPRGDQDRILLERIHDGEVLPPHSFSAAAANTVELEDMDVVVVRDIMSFRGSDPVQVFDGGGRTGTIEIEKAEALRDFLGRLWRFLPQFDIETAVLERSSEGNSSTHVEFNVREVLAGDPQGDIVVQPGDIIVFPGREPNVYVTGEVQEPGGVPFQPGLTAERYVAFAGGPTSAGSFNKLRIYSRNGTEREASRTSPVYRGDTIVVGQKTSRLLGTFFVGLTSLTGLVLSVIALTK